MMEEIPFDHYDEDSSSIVESIDFHKDTFEECEQSHGDDDNIPLLHPCLMDE